MTGLMAAQGPPPQSSGFLVSRLCSAARVQAVTAYKSSCLSVCTRKSCPGLLNRSAKTEDWRTAQSTGGHLSEGFLSAFPIAQAVADIFFLLQKKKGRLDGFC